MLNKKNCVKFRPQEPSYKRSFWPTLSRIFWKIIFRPIMGAAPPNFYMR